MLSLLTKQVSNTSHTVITYGIKNCSVGAVTVTGMHPTYMTYLKHYITIYVP